MTEEPPRVRQPSEVDYGELPELARALRALGSPRRSGGTMQQQFFAPLLDARRLAAASSPEDAVRAFDAAELTRAFDRMMEIIVHGWPDARESARRALRAELRERARDYRRALDTLDDRAAALLAASTDDERLQSWRAWTIQLAALFDAADRAWMAVRSIVDAIPPR
jgi:hypothetical protein